MYTFQKYFIESNLLKGGKSDGMSVEQLAKKHSLPVDIIEKEIKMGIEVEREHTTDNNIARKIAMDHIFEFPNYYQELKKMEKKLNNE